ncbi:MULTISPECIES: hypothetical protein [Pasteurellaceae]|uniref:Hemophilus-specific protein n=1 Tax=Pasteurella atlantica TaxID=2827233 RepID=A0AAW8CPQ4_9PAST|nr:hypothetical protein [Pasteurella atlantica]MBR0574465.1 hypothetical protein [Pasteurella atlantica]MDP8039342.1 hypothetical protein [Pasteurella atlantica]MDP8041434.1 hypothetical protein [Pasteurella atlantica]MDP8043641.1 hypothetical protein [Pasteurella atlantica]MDP8045655.1 hypothetical protein [Pasteurella atlantica]
MIDNKKFEAEIEQMRATTIKLQAETMKLQNESAKLNKELKWYEVSIIVAVTLVVVAIAKLFL